MSLLKAKMPMGYKDPAKDGDGGMAGRYSELKEPGEEGKTGIIPRKTSGWHKIVLYSSRKRSSFLGSREDKLSHCPTLPNPRALPANRTRSAHPHYLFLLLELDLFLIPSAT